MTTEPTDETRAALLVDLYASEIQKLTADLARCTQERDDKAGSAETFRQAAELNRQACDVAIGERDEANRRLGVLSKAHDEALQERDEARQALERARPYIQHRAKCQVSVEAKFQRCVCGHAGQSHFKSQCRFCACCQFKRREPTCTCGLDALLTPETPIKE